MPFTTRNPADLELNKTYKFTFDDVIPRSIPYTPGGGIEKHRLIEIKNHYLGWWQIDCVYPRNSIPKRVPQDIIDQLRECPTAPSYIFKIEVYTWEKPYHSYRTMYTATLTDDYKFVEHTPYGTWTEWDE